MTSDTSKLLRFWVHKQRVDQTFYQLGLMSSQHFQEVAGKQVYDALHDVTMMLQIWACKQVTNIAGVDSNQAVYIADHDPMCPRCNEEEETCGHVLCYDEEGRVKNLNYTIDLLDSWMTTVGTNNPLRRCLTDYARKRGGVSMEHIVWGKGPKFYKLGQSMDKIGWRRYMEGMVSSEVLGIQA